MTWSLNELDVETKKAIRGAGLSWGLAEEGGKAVRWLAAHGVDPLPALADVLERHDRRERITSAFKMTETGRWTADAPICPIALGVTLCDHADRLATEGCVVGPVARPLLLAPFVAAAARILGRPLQLEADGRQIMLDERGDPFGDLSMLDASDAVEIRCIMIADRPSISPVKAASTHGIETDARPGRVSRPMGSEPMSRPASDRAGKAPVQV